MEDNASVSTTGTDIAEKLQKALDLLGPNGEYWVQHDPHSASQKYCMVTACAEIVPNGGSEKFELWDALMAQIPDRLRPYEPLFGWNDRRGRTFSEVREVFQKAIEAAKS